MLGLLATFSLYLLAGAGAFSLWYFWAMRQHRIRALQLVVWVETALTGHGHVSGIQWISPSRFQVPVRLSSNVFRNACIVVQMAQIEMPLRWLMNRARRKQETMTFQADFDMPPGFDLEVRNHRAFARSRKDLDPSADGWRFQHTGPFVLSTRMDWKREITDVMNFVAATADREFTSIRFRRRSPNFAAAFPLDSIAPGSANRAQVFDLLRELATSASPSLS